MLWNASSWPVEASAYFFLFIYEDNEQKMGGRDESSAVTDQLVVTIHSIDYNFVLFISNIETIRLSITN